jgi:transposase
MITRQEIYDLYEQGPEALADLIELLLKQNEQLIQRVKELEERLNKNSRNSDKPPSSDGLKKRPPKPKRIRDKKKRQPGGQVGHQGNTLKMSADVDETIRHEHTNCQGCGHDLTGVEGEIRRKKQVVDIPQPQIIITEHQSIEKVCPCCSKKNAGKLPEHLTGNVQYGSGLRALVNYLIIYQLLPYERTTELLKAIYGISPSKGTLYQMLQDGYTQLEGAEKAIREAITTSPVIHCDETGHRVGAKTRWLHVASTKLMTYYYSNRARGALAHQAGDVLPHYKGIAVHDFYHSYLKVECQHALCNAHLIRELKSVFERDPSQRWANSLVRLLVTAKKMTHIAQHNGKTSLSEQILERLSEKYDALLVIADQLNPKAKPNGKPGRTKQTKTRNLLDRLLTYKMNILRFLFDFKVPFDNNLAERDLRMVKVQQKISNCFRSEFGAEMFCRIRGYISTLLKQGYDVFHTLTKVLQGNVLIPIPAE